MGRFAPSPTGRLHFGSLRTALAAWLFARAAHGRFLLRIEDLDPDRSRPEWEAVQLTALTELGIHWDAPVVRQSEAADHHRAALARLSAAGRTYPCFCTRAEIAAAATAPHPPATPAAQGPLLPAGAYRGTCRHLSAAQVAERLRRGEPHAIRFAADPDPVGFDDGLAGRQVRRVDDFVLSRRDGVLAYQLAVVVDDARAGVNQVVRGADLLDSTPRQIVLMRALGLPEPAWIHVPLVLAPDGRRLAKRDGDLGLDPDPPATLGRLARSLGIVVGRAPASAADLLDGFDPARIPREPWSLGGHG